MKRYSIKRYIGIVSVGWNIIYSAYKTGKNRERYEIFIFIRNNKLYTNIQIRYL